MLWDQFLSPRGVHARERGVKIEHTGAREISRKTVILRQVSDGPARFRLAGIAPENQSAASGWPHRGEQSLHEGGLPRPVGPKQSEDSASANVERHAIDGAHLPPRPPGEVNFGEVLRRYGVFGIH